MKRGENERKGEGNKREEGKNEKKRKRGNERKGRGSFIKKKFSKKEIISIISRD